MDRISKIYCINLKSRTDKRDFMVQQSKFFKFDFEFLTVDLHQDPARGCLESHLQIIKTAKDLHLPNVLILEDDAEFIRFLHSLPEFPIKWDMLYLGGNVRQIFYEQSEALSQWKRAKCFTTHAYLLNSTLYDKIIDELPTWDKQIDVYYADILHPNYNCYILHPQMVIQKPGYSDIEQKNVDYNCYINNNIFIKYNYLYNSLQTDGIFFINMYRRLDRYKKIMKWSNNLGLIINRWNGIDGSTLVVTDRIKHLFRNNDFNFKRGVLGCALSHYELWVYLKNSNVYNSILILEDDPSTQKDFVINWLKYRSQLNDTIQDHHLIYLGGIYPNYYLDPDYKNGDLIYPNFTKPNSINHIGAFSYILDKKGAEILLDRVEKEGINRAIDWYLVDTFNLYPEMNPLFAHPPLVYSVTSQDSDTLQY